jgi:TRAP-type uncharacterized transport system fused permease subunit
MLMGEPLAVIRAVLTAIIGVVLLSCGVRGYLFRAAAWPVRLILLVGGVAMMVPELRTDIMGIALGSVAGLWQFVRGKSTRAARG